MLLLVDEILALKNSDKSAQISHLEKQINDLVYKLYGLSKDEIRIIEGGEK